MPDPRPTSIASARTFLFVPGHRPDRFSKAVGSGADCVIVDLEDSVAPERKAEARENVRLWRGEGGAGMIRINDATSPSYEADVASICDSPCAVMLPKASSATQVEDLLRRLPDGSCVVPLLETALGILDARSICSVRGVVRVAFGAGDLSSELGIDEGNWDALAWARSQIVLASAANQLSPPIDGVTAVIHDGEAVVADMQRSAALGFTAKLCIHPTQIRPVHDLLAPRDEQVQLAREIVQAAGHGSVTVVRGRMVDGPSIDRARRLLNRTCSTGL